MKTLKSAFLVLSNSVIGTILLTMPATAVDFRFSFENALNGNGTIAGLIRGLEEGTGAASSVEVLSNTIGFGIGEFLGSPVYNSWTVLDGNLVAFDFLSFGDRNTSPAVTNATLFFNSSKLDGALFRAGLSSESNSVTIGNSAVTAEDINLTFTRIDDDIKSVPESTSILSLLVVGAAAIGTVLKRKLA